ncbi:MAG: hypothetical protein ACKO1F_13110 [Flammeovirgaceae bacterium]
MNFDKRTRWANEGAPSTENKTNGTALAQQTEAVDSAVSQKANSIEARAYPAFFIVVY